MVLLPGAARPRYCHANLLAAQGDRILVNELHPLAELRAAALRIAETIASNSPTAVQAAKRAVRLGEGETLEQAIAIMMDNHWRSAVHPDRAEGILAFNEGRDPTFQDSDY